MQPISQNNPNIHKGPTSSAEFNKIRNDLHYDLMTLFTIANEHEEEIRSNMDILLRENFFLQSRINELEKKLEEVKRNQLYRQNGEQKQRMIKSFYTLDNLMDGDPTKEAYINTLYGYATIPAGEIVSHITHLSDDGRVMVPESLSYSLEESLDTMPIDETTGQRTYYVVEDENIELAFDRDKNSFWVHTSSFPDDSGVTEVFGKLRIVLPVDTLNNVYANTLTINPVPEYSMTIHDIHYKGYGDQWFRIPNYPMEKNEEGEEVPKEIQQTGKLIFSFPKTEITEIVIYFSQPHWFRNGNMRDFVYGFQEIDVEYRSYNNSEAEFVTIFSLEGTTKRFRRIEEPIVVPVLGSPQDISHLVEHRLYYDRSLTNEFSFGSEIMAPIQTVYVKTILKGTGAGDVIPMIKQIQLDFTYDDITS